MESSLEVVVEGSLEVVVEGSLEVVVEGSLEHRKAQVAAYFHSLYGERMSEDFSWLV